MGYTHYWSHDEKLDEKALAEAVVDVKKVADAVAAKGIVLRDGSGEGAPVFSDDRICFNGDGQENLDHETFLFPLGGKDALLAKRLHGCYWDFCKTARKPYDLAVCATLLVLKHHLGSQLRISSDGGRHQLEWLPAERLVKEALGYQVEFVREETMV